ncbi:hypothetical protein KIW84_073465 [Lathyrus oleraceus]|uniref:DUF4283 domain-containing protein n=1 Tax=Pisum sativum TaxID=3888 RepID=A0A9D4VNR4_PEA|nr:hypothetical protein KIW84_073465 [Pisum sativum]
MEEKEIGELKELLNSHPDWISEWFSNIRPWKPDDVDNEKMTWLRVFGVPCHTWYPKFFEFINAPLDPLEKVVLSEAHVDGQDGLEKVGEKVSDGVSLEKSLCCSMNDGCLGKINLEKSVEENRTIPTSDMTEVIVKGLWGYDPLGWSAKGEVGKFGGVLIVWKLGSITPNYSFKGRADFGEWVVGDFNAVKNLTEKFGKVAYRMNMEMVEFSDFIDHMDLIDMPTIGNTLYWSSAVGGIASRINRLLVLEGPIEAWNIMGQEIGARDISNHIPVWTKSSNLN